MASLVSHKLHSQRSSGRLEAVGNVRILASWNHKLGGSLEFFMDGEERCFKLVLDGDEIIKLRDYLNDPQKRSEYFDKPPEKE